MDEPKNQEFNTVLANLKNFWDNNGTQTVHSFINDISAWPEDVEDTNFTVSDLKSNLTDDSILVLTANQVEANIMVRLLYRESGNKKLSAIVADGCWYRFGSIGGHKIVHIQPQDTSSFTPNGSCRALISAFRRFHPKLVVSLGVAFGIDEKKHHLGDVLISEKLCAYDAKNKRTNGKIKLDEKGFYQTDSSLMCAWKNLLSYSRFPGTSDSKSRPFDWYCGLMLSGGTVLSDSAEKKRLLKAIENRGHKNCIGGEMEGNGMYFTCAEENIPCVVIKGICDWGEEKNGWDKVIEIINKNRNERIEWENDTIKDCIQALAMTNAFTAFTYLLSYYSAISDIQDSSHRTTKIVKWSPRFQFPIREIRQIITAITSLALLFSSIYLVTLVALVEQIGKEVFCSSHFQSAIFIFVLSASYLGYRIFEYRSRPEKLVVEAANIHIRKLDFQNCVCEIKNINDYPLKNCEIAWISKRKHMVIRVHKVDEVYAHNKMKIGYQYAGIPYHDANNVYDVPCPIIPDALQFEYDLNGKRYCHVFRNPKQEKHNMLSYCEYIHIIGSMNSKNIIRRHCCVPNFDVE